MNYFDQNVNLQPDIKAFNKDIVNHERTGFFNLMLIHSNLFYYQDLTKVKAFVTAPYHAKPVENLVALA